MKRLFAFLLVTVMLLTLVSCSGSMKGVNRDIQQTETEKVVEYSVKFNLNGGTLVTGEAIQKVPEGGSAEAPVVENGNMELTWDGDFTNITKDTLINAVWEKKEMTNEELAAYGQSTTVTLEVETVTGSVSRGSGFFVDAEGTIVTAFHVIEGATDISVVVSEGGSYAVEKVVAFNPVYDLAIVKIDYSPDQYLSYAEDDPVVGEKVVAVGSALGTLTGTFTTGTISSIKREVGKIECIQTDAGISSGNSGGPLLNKYGEVVGINCFSYTSGQNLNLAVKTSMLDNIGANRNFTMREMKEWYNKEASRSYSPFDGDGNYYYSIVNNYDTVTGAECVGCIDEEGEVQIGYHDMMVAYMYDYDPRRLDQYKEYLKNQGFVYDDTQIDEDGLYYDTYINEKDGYEVTLTYDQADGYTLIMMYMS